MRQRHKLARVHWSLGQTLLPEHFAAEGDALEQGIRLSGELAGLPATGVATLAWNEALLARGSLSISSLTAVIPAGEGDLLVDVPGNAKLSAFSLEATGKSELAVHLHVLETADDAEGVPLYETDSKLVKRDLRVLQLSNEPVLDGAVATLKLAELSKGLDGVWKLSPTFAPELLLVGPNPFLDGILLELDGMLDQARGQLRTQILDSLLRSDRLTNARRTLFEVVRVQALREDMKHGVYPHPYQFFDALRRLYCESACYLELMPDEMFPAEMPVYRHDEIALGLDKWRALLAKGFRPQATRTVHQPFENRDGLFSIAPLPLDVPHASESYLLVQRVDPGERVPLDGVKLASEGRLPLVRRLALTGIPFRYLPYPAFPHAFGPEIDWYQLQPGEEWDHAVREDSLAFYVTPALQDAQVSLYWRKA